MTGRNIALLVAALLLLPAVAVGSDTRPAAAVTQVNDWVTVTDDSRHVEDAGLEAEPFPAPDGVHWRLETVVDGEKWTTIDLSAPGAPAIFQARGWTPADGNLRILGRRQPRVKPDGGDPAPSGGGSIDGYWYEWYTPWEYASTIDTNGDYRVTVRSRSASNACNAPSAYTWSIKYTTTEAGRNSSRLSFWKVLELGYDTTHQESLEVDTEVSIPACWEARSRTITHNDWVKFDAVRYRYGCEIDLFFRCTTEPLLIREEHDSRNTAREIWNVEDSLTWRRLR